MSVSAFWQWASNLVKGFATAGEWLLSPIQGLDISPLALCGFGGLLIFLSIAVVKWFIS